MFSMDIFCFSCLKNKNSLVDVTTTINEVSYEEKLIYCRLYYNIPEDCRKLLCDLCCHSINNVYEFKKKFMEKQELLQTYLQSFEHQKRVKKLQTMSVNVNSHQYIPISQNGVLNVDLTQEEIKEEQIFDLTVDDDEIDDALFESNVSTVNFTLPNPFVQKEPKIEEIVNENTETNELLEVIVKTKEEDETSEVENEREFINNLPRIEENYEIVEDKKVTVNKNGLKIVIRKNNSECSEEKEKFECVFCGKIFYNLQSLKRHKLSHPTSNIPCRICKKVLKNRQSFQLHISLHYKKFNCNLCNKEYTTKQNLLYHRAKKHLKTNFEKRYPSRSQSIDSEKNESENFNMEQEITSATVDPKNLEEFQKTLKYCNSVVAKRGRPKKVQNDQNFCKKCNYQFANKQVYIKHYTRYHTNHECENCNKIFESKRSLSLHITSQSCKNRNEIKIYCEQCDQYFSSSVNFNKHVDGAHTEHKCQKCQMQFKNKMMLRHHQKKDCQSKNLKCEFCNRTFKLTMHLNRHLTTHIKDDIYNDDINNDDDNKHLMEETDFKCSICYKTFSNKVKLDVHLLIHSGVYNFPCKYCPHMFTTKDQLQSHVTRMHRNKIYTCKYCLKSFKTILYYKRHIAQQHSNFAPKLHCDFCDKTFTKLRHLRSHKKTHTATEKFLQCTECPKVFLAKSALVRHMVVHTNERKHVCKYCGRKFNLGSYLVRHMKMMHEDDENFEDGVKLTIDSK